MRIDIQDTPITLDEIAALRRQAESVLASCAKQESIINVMMLFVLASLWVLNELATEDVLLAVMVLGMALAVLWALVRMPLILVVAFVLAVFALAFEGVLPDTPINGLQVLRVVGIIGTAALIAVLWGVLVALFASNSRDEAQSDLHGLSNIAPEQCPNALALCQADSVLASYQSAVAKEGRQLIKAEYQAMWHWEFEREDRLAREQHKLEQLAKQATQRAACEALSSPILS